MSGTEPATEEAMHKDDFDPAFNNIPEELTAQEEEDKDRRRRNEGEEFGGTWL